MIRIIKSKGDSIETSLKIIIDPNGNFQFSVDDFWLQRFKADVYGKRTSTIWKLRNEILQQMK